MPGDLQFVWDGPRKTRAMRERPAISESWGQLAGAMHRLAVIAGYLDELPGRKRTETALEQLAYHLEGYFARTYELRERAGMTAAGLLNLPWTREEVGRVKSETDRAAFEASIPVKYRDTLAPLFALAKLIDADSKTRNEHTHEQFLTLMLVVPTDTLTKGPKGERFVSVYDPLDVLAEAENESEAKKLRKVLRRAIRCVADDYAERARNILNETRALLENTAPFIENRAARASRPARP